MGQYFDAYVIYGFFAPDDLDESDMEEALRGRSHPDVGYGMQGTRDGHKRAWVSTFCASASLAVPVSFELPDSLEVEVWHQALLEAAEVNGWPVPEPRWIVLGSLS